MRTTSRPRLLGALCTAAAATMALGLAGTAPAHGATAPVPPAEGRVLGADRAEAIPGRYIVALDDAPSIAANTAAADLVAEHGGTVRTVYSTAFKGFALKATAAQARKLAAQPGVRYVQADAEVRATGTQPNPPSWGLDRVDGVKDSSYAYPNEGEGVTAYIVDTGLYRQHTDFEGRASSGYDFIDNDADSADCQGHGTHVAGTVGGKSYGVAKKAKLVGVRVLNCQGTGSTSQIVAGMDWVVRNAQKPAVANLSLGGGIDRAMDDAVQGAINAGIPVAVAAGNDNRDACNTSPARLPAAITLGSTDSNDGRSSFSNYGRCLDLFAPGGSIVSTRMGGGTQTMSGTSMATPHAAGAAAIHLSAHPDATPQQVRDALVNNALSGVVTNPGSSSPNRLLDVSDLGGGPSEPGKPVAAFTAQCSTTTPACAFDASGSTDPDGGIASYAWDFGDGTEGEGAKPSHTYTKAGTYAVKLTVTDDSGESGTLTKQVTAGTTEPSPGQAPTASFALSCWYGDCSFDASASSDPDGDIASYAWKFGDGATGSGATVTHRYPSAQRTYTAQLTVTDRGGRTGTTSRQVSCFAFTGGQPLCFAG
ncbi:S8 family serine peptidase [Streptomyces sp. CA-278952]|uniref:S8 family serine peptidase n=1 Tax=Streptomyces sp. CA-278952 TaxID=2980556 RepID=UPI002368A0C1|nr:S8 family serine peptidase [Streptomyces sp. CA-278952]WDG32534.1 S8 family serine peptidase [Streptomyces sp. CA-278952]